MVRERKQPHLTELGSGYTGGERPVCCDTPMLTAYTRRERRVWVPFGFHCLNCGGVVLYPRGGGEKNERE